MQRYNFTNPLFLFKIESMIRRFYIILCFAFLFTCDDGDIINITLEFDEELERCDDFEDVYLLYDSREDPNESLTLILPKPTYDYLFTTATPADTPEQFNVSGGVQFNYRIYNKVLQDEVLCSVLSDPDLVVLEDYQADSAAMVEVTVSIEDDDNDGIPSTDEDLNGNGDFDDDDFDGDGIANYLDEDDDNDNVLTINEDDDDDNDDNPFTDMRDTDGDGNPDYLDMDDDGDGIDTRLEDENENNNPLDDFEETSSLPNTPRFLDNTAAEGYNPANIDFINNEYTRSVRTIFTITNANLGPINSTVINFGTYKSSITIND